jgi:hypothetical protein
MVNQVHRHRLIMGAEEFVLEKPACARNCDDARWGASSAAEIDAQGAQYGLIFVKLCADGMTAPSWVDSTESFSALFLISLQYLRNGDSRTRRPRIPGPNPIFQIPVDLVLQPRIDAAGAELDRPRKQSALGQPINVLLAVFYSAFAQIRVTEHARHVVTSMHIRRCVAACARK